MFLVDKMVDGFQQTYERLAALPESELGWVETTKTLRAYIPRLKPRSVS